jgi:hypothetical protein
VIENPSHVTVLLTSPQEMTLTSICYCAAGHPWILVRHSSICCEPCKRPPGYCREGNAPTITNAVYLVVWMLQNRWWLQTMFALYHRCKHALA